MRDLFSVVLVLSVIGCEESREPTEPSEAAVLLALEHQSEGISPDSSLVRRIDSALARAREVTPVSIQCPIVVPEFRYDRFRLHGVLEPAFSAWAAGELLTGDASLDSQVSEFAFASVELQESDLFGDSFTVQLAAPVRTDRLIEQLSQHPLLERGGTQPNDGELSDIEMSIDDDSIEFFFWVGWGGCPSGCINKHFWRTLVPNDPDEPAALLEDYGDEIVPPLWDCLNE
jgi:hypothetical protein